MKQESLSEMREFIAKGIQDRAADRVRDFDPQDIKTHGRRKSQRDASD